LKVFLCKINNFNCIEGRHLERCFNLSIVNILVLSVYSLHFNIILFNTAVNSAPWFKWKLN